MNNLTKQNQELYCVYLHTCVVTNKSYIGQTVDGMVKRFNKHIRDAKAGSNLHFHKALRKYGHESFTSRIIYVAFERDSPHLKEVEMQLIDTYNTYNNGYNMTKGGDGYGSGEDHPLFGRTGKNNPMFGKYGEDHPTYGRKNTREHRAAISAANLGKKKSPETCARMSIAQMGNQKSRDLTVYRFEHKDGTIFEGTRHDFITVYNLDSSSLTKVMKGVKQKTIKGWRFIH